MSSVLINAVRIGAPFIFGLAAVLALGGHACAAPTLAPSGDATETPAESSRPLGGAAGGGISTGQRHLDLLLEQQGALSGGAPPAKPGASAASMPRAADLRQALRVEALSQDRDKREKAGAKDGSEATAKLPGLGAEGLLRESDNADPTTRRTWEGGKGPSAGDERRGAGSEAPSAVQEALREVVAFLRNHRIELFAGLALLGLAGALIRMYARAR